MVQARLGTKNDIQRIVEMRNEACGYETFTPPYVEDRLSRKNCVVAVAEADGEVVGFGFDELGVDTKNGLPVNEVTHLALDPKWNPFNPLDKITAMKAIAAVFYQETVKGDVIGRYRILPDTHFLIRTAINGSINFQKTGTDQSGNEIYEESFDTTKRDEYLANNPNLIK